MNQILDKMKAAFLQKADKRLLPVIDRLVESGKKLMYAEQNHGLLKQQLGDGSDPEAIGAGVAKVVGILFKESGGKAPMPALIPAAMLLLGEVLQFLEDAGAPAVTPDFLAECTQATASAVLQMLGVSPEQIQGYVDKAARQGPQPAAPAAPAAGIVGGA
jgi:hypothetical protein